VGDQRLSWIEELMITTRHHDSQFVDLEEACDWTQTALWDSGYRGKFGPFNTDVKKSIHKTQIQIQKRNVRFSQVSRIKSWSDKRL
jgi:hypothetical protein